MVPIGKLLIVSGILLVVLGLFFLWGPKVPWLGRLPGDILIERPRFTLFFPIATCLILSLILTILANLFFRR